jgi:hypothetical protein
VQVDNITKFNLRVHLHELFVVLFFCRNKRIRLLSLLYLILKLANIF